MQLSGTAVEAVGGLLAILLCLWVPVTVECCMETAWSSGTMESRAVLINRVTLSGPERSSCVCCAVCHTVRNCASFSYGNSSGECQLYNRVASFATLTPHEDDEWRYFVMPGRSQHEEFCRQDSDCQVEGDFCRGRVCTDLPTVTCRVIYDAFGAGRRYDTDFGDTHLFGWINNQTMRLVCLMGGRHRGYTRLLASSQNFQFDRQSIMSYNVENNNSIPAYSILSLAEQIRLTGTGKTYQLSLLKRSDSRSGKLLIIFSVPRHEPVLAAFARPNVGSVQVISKKLHTNWSFSLPYLPGSGPTLLTVNADEADGTDGAVAREDGSILWGDWDLPLLYLSIQE